MYLNLYKFIPLTLLSLNIIIVGCNNSDEVSNKNDEKLNTQKFSNDSIKENVIRTTTEKGLELNVPEGFIPKDTIKGDLNGDDIPDYVLIIKQNKKESFVQNEFNEKVDRNRRGLLIYNSQSENYTLTSKNLNCFSSENEDGEGYFPPELGVYIIDNKLFIHYGHGRYGSWEYIFQHRNGYMELIGYHSYEQDGPVINEELKIKLPQKNNFNHYKHK